MKKIVLLLLPVLLLSGACRSYDISSLISQDELKRQIAAGNLRVRVPEEQIPFVADMLLDEDPLVRLAALKLMENNRYDDFLNPLLETTLDEDSRVSREAYRILKAYPDWTLTFLEKNLPDMGDLLCLNALTVLAELDAPTSRAAMVALFDSDSDRKKNGAAKTLSSLVTLNDPLMEELKSSEDPSRRAGYYRIVGHYGETTLIPLLFDGISDPSPDVWGACISSIYAFGEKAFPFVDRYIQSGDYLMSLSCLQILEAIKSEKSLPMLISFYGNANRMLAQRAAIIVQTYGEAAIPYLGEGIEPGKDYGNRLILWTMREINSPLALTWYLEQLDRRDPALESDLLLSLTSLGESVQPALRAHAGSADPYVAKQLVAMLAEEGDKALVDDRTCSYYLISSLDEEAFSSYFTLSGVGPVVEEDFRQLRRVRDLDRIIRDAEEGNNRYFLAYREILSLQDKADEALKNSLKSRRESLAAESARLMGEYESLKAQIALKESQMDNLPQGEQKTGEEQIFRYLDARREAVDIWIRISPRFRDVAQLVYNDMDQNVDTMMAELTRQ